MLYDLIDERNKQSRYGNWDKFDILIVCIGTLAGLLLAILVLRMRHQMHDLSLVMLGAMGTLPSVTPFELLKLSTQQPTNTDSATSKLIAMITNLGDFEKAIVVVMILLFLVSLLFSYIALIRARSPQSYIYLEIHSPTEIVQLKLCQFPSANRCFGVKMSQSDLVMTLTNYGIVTKLTFSAPNWYFWNFLNGISTLLPTTLWLSPWSAKKISRIIAQDEHSIKPLIVHTHEFVFAESIDHTEPTDSETNADDTEV